MSFEVLRGAVRRDAEELAYQQVRTVQRSELGKRGILRCTRSDDWKATFTVDIDDDLVDEDQLATWLDIGGHRIGLGDWRPQSPAAWAASKLEVLEN